MLERTPRYRMLGVAVEAYTMDMLHGAIGAAVSSGARIIVANHNLHSVYLAKRDPQLRRFFDVADIIHIDGMPLVWIGRLLGYPFERRHRTTYADWMLCLAEEAAARGWRIFYVGSRPGVAERGASVLRGRFPKLEIDVVDGYFDARPESPQNRDLLERISAAAPQVLMVGMSMPRQEKWILENLPDLRANAILPCGAAMDYVAGVVPTPPRWAGRLGLEWLFRLAAEPKRLGHRYLVEPLSLVGPLIQDLRHRSTRREAPHDVAVR